MGKLRIVWVALLFVLGCSSQWDQPGTSSTRAEARKTTVSSTYAGNDFFPDEITEPSDGNTKPAASVDVAIEGLADRTMWLRNRMFGGKSDRFNITMNAYQDPANPRFQMGALGGVGAGWVQADNTDAGLLVIPMQMPGKGEISLVRAWLACDALHGAMPATKPVLSMYRSRAQVKESRVLIKTATDPQTLVGGYEALHYIELVLTGGDLVVFDIDDPSTNFDLWLEFTGEAGANSQPLSLVLKGITVDFLAL